MKTFLWWLGWVWALPVTLAGVLLALVTCEWVYGPESGAFVFTARRWFRESFFHRNGVGAFCWGACIFQPTTYNGPGWQATLRHELVHFRQARIFGPFLPLAYGIGSLVALAQGRHPYRDCFLESWARKESGR
jgi:hypothetical protein